jgi:membrane-associated protein
MDFLLKFVDFILHMDKQLPALVDQYRWSVYPLLFLIVFLETGVVVAPFLPGDSLLFAAGATAAIPDCGLSIAMLFLLLWIAAVLGDALNYHIGRWAGPRVFTKTDSRLLNQKHLARAQRFYEKHGGKTIFLARFAPVIRTFAPFVAGIGKMSYWRFAAWNVSGGLCWTGAFLFAGYFFGKTEFVKNNFPVIIVMIIIISMVPLLIEYLRYRNEEKKQKTG